jgi:signal transduction histidine kinase
MCCIPLDFARLPIGRRRRTGDQEPLFQRLCLPMVVFGQIQSEKTAASLSVFTQCCLSDSLLGVLNDITDRIQAEEAHKAEAERAVIAEERNRIARDLHDSVTQALYTTSLIAEALPAVWETRWGATARISA